MKRASTGNQRQVWDPLDLRPTARPWFWAVVVVLVSLTHGPTFIDSLRPAPTEGVDFFQEWASAKNLSHGLPIYTDLEQTASLYLGYKRRPGEELLFTKNAHPPSSILLAIPFTLLSYPDATLAWNVVSLVAFAITLWLILNALPVRPALWLVLPATALFLLCNPLRQQVNQGQLNLVLLLLLTGGWVADRRGNVRSAGVAFGVATAIKLFPGFVLLYFALRKRWTVVTYGFGTFVAVTVLTFAVLGVDTYVAYLREVLPQVSTYRNGWINVSLTGFWTKWFEAGALSPMPLPPLPRFLSPLWPVPLVARAGMVVSLIVILVLWARAVPAQPVRSADRSRIWTHAHHHGHHFAALVGPLPSVADSSDVSALDWPFQQAPGSDPSARSARVHLVQSHFFLERPDSHAIQRRKHRATRSGADCCIAAVRCIAGHLRTCDHTARRVFRNDCSHRTRIGRVFVAYVMLSANPTAHLNVAART